MKQIEKICNVSYRYKRDKAISAMTLYTKLHDADALADTSSINDRDDNFQLYCKHIKSVFIIVRNENSVDIFESSWWI